MLRLFLFAAACALGLVACAGPAAVAPTRAQLEARVAEHPRDVEALRDLGAILAVEEDYGPALGAFARALAVDPTDGQTLYFAGLVSEALDRPAEAEDTYARYLNVDVGDVYRDSLRARLNGLVRARLQREFAEALAVEDSVTTGAAGDAVGVLPFVYRGDNAEYQALGRGLAEVLSIDLASVQPLEVVERTRLQALLAEYDLARQGVLDPRTAPRAGRLLRAGRLVGGEVDVQGEALRVESAVWADSLRQLETTEGGVEDLFRVQKSITLDVLEALGVVVSETERAELMEAPTADLVAFLLYSRGLLREDVGDFVGAARLYDEAFQRDPSFALAAQAREGAALSAATSGPPGPALTAAASSTLEPVPVEGSSAVQRVANGLRETLVGHVAPGEGSREPGVEGSQAGALGPLPDPPAPPSAGQNLP